MPIETKEKPKPEDLIEIIEFEIARVSHPIIIRGNILCEVEDTKPSDYFSYVSICSKDAESYRLADKIYDLYLPLNSEPRMMRIEISNPVRFELRKGDTLKAYLIGSEDDGEITKAGISTGIGIPIALKYNGLFYVNERQRVEAKDNNLLLRLINHIQLNLK